MMSEDTALIKSAIGSCVKLSYLQGMRRERRERREGDEEGKEGRGGKGGKRRRREDGMKERRWRG